MQLLDTSSNYLLPASSSETSLKRNTQPARTKLSMVWVKEFDGERDRLVARWVQQD